VRLRLDVAGLEAFGEFILKAIGQIIKAVGIEELSAPEQSLIDL
jgi:hypothetical protein